MMKGLTQEGEYHPQEAVGCMCLCLCLQMCICINLFKITPLLSCFLHFGTETCLDCFQMYLLMHLVHLLVCQA